MAIGTATGYNGSMASLSGGSDPARVRSGSPQVPGPSSGISQEERDELMAQIEKAVARAPVAADRGHRDYTPRRSGLTFPLALNAAAVVLIALAAVALPMYFNRQTISLTSRAGTALSGESTLVGAMKREAETQLQSKSDEIGKIQGALARASGELDALKAGAAAQMQKKEQDLQAAFEAKLAAEKSRLQTAGLSSAAVDRQMASLRGQLQVARESQLAEFQKQLRDNLARKQAALDASVAESRRSLTRAEAEKAQLQAQLDSSTQAAASAQDEKALLAARLEALTAQSQREQLAIDQITSSYAAVALAVKSSQYDDARSTLSSLAAFLDQPGVASLPAVQRRRSVDFFLVESLSQQVAARAGGSAPPAAAAEPSTAAPEPALSPEQAATLARLSDFARALAAGDAQYAAGNFAAALDKYGAALALLKDDVPGVTRAAGRIADAGFRQGQAEILARMDRAARPAMDAADALARRGSHADAIAAYAAVLRSWPGSSYVSRSLAGITSSLDSLLRSKDEDFARREQARKSAANDLIGTVGAGLSSAARSAERTASAAQKELIALLDAKVKVRGILGSDAIKEQYPGLADALERYLLVYGEEKKSEGRTVALQDIATVLDYLAGTRAKEALTPLWSRYGDNAARAAFQQLLDRLRQLYP